MLLIFRNENKTLLRNEKSLGKTTLDWTTLNVATKILLNKHGKLSKVQMKAGFLEASSEASSSQKVFLFAKWPYRTQLKLNWEFCLMRHWFFCNWMTPQANFFHRSSSLSAVLVSPDYGSGRIWETFLGDVVDITVSRRSNKVMFQHN